MSKSVVAAVVGMTLAGGSLFLVSNESGAADGVVYKSPTCGCCSKWITHMEEAGFDLDVADVQSVVPYKKQFGVPYGMGSCHTAMIDGYFVEGHVPAADVQRLLKEKLDIIGLTAPGMPVGSPGMEVPGRTADSYTVYAIDKAGNKTVFARY